MRSHAPSFILLLVVITAAPSAAQAQSSDDDAVVIYAKSIDVAKLDSTLSSQRLEDWLLHGPARIDELYWNISQDCDLKDAEPDADGDLPLCVKIGFRRQNMVGFGVLRVGTIQHGVGGQPVFFYLDVLRPFSTGSYDKLSDFPRFLDGIDHAQNAKNEIHLRATVQDVVPLADYLGKATPVDFDPRFALRLRIESVDPAISDFVAGAVVTFVIHSPALLLLGEDGTKGKTYDFSLGRETEQGKIRFFGLKVEKTAGPLHGCADKPDSGKPAVEAWCRAEPVMPLFIGGAPVVGQFEY